MTQMMQPSQFAPAERCVVEVFKLKMRENKKIICPTPGVGYHNTILIDFSNSWGTAKGIAACVGPSGQAPACKTLIDKFIPDK